MTETRHIFVGQRDRFFQQLVLARGDALPTCGVEGDGLECAETHPLALKLQKQLFVLRHGGGRAGLRKADAERVEYLQYFQLVLDGIGDRGALRAVAQRGIQHADAFFQCVAALFHRKRRLRRKRLSTLLDLLVVQVYDLLDFLIDLGFHGSNAEVISALLF